MQLPLGRGRPHHQSRAGLLYLTWTLMLKCRWGLSHLFSLRAPVASALMQYGFMSSCSMTNDKLPLGLFLVGAFHKIVIRHEDTSCWFQQHYVSAVAFAVGSCFCCWLMLFLLAHAFPAGLCFCCWLMLHSTKTTLAYIKPRLTCDS